MAGPDRDPGSFRDPSGYVFLREDRVWRTASRSAAECFEQIEHSGLLTRLIEERRLIATTVIEVTHEQRTQLVGARGETPCLVLEHPRLRFVSYPYEWTFSQLKDAALAHLDLQVLALEHNAVLSDASPYNLQFVNGKPVFIDVLSLRPYRENELWEGYNQFCRLFLLPLLIEAWRGVPFQPYLRAGLDGMDLRDTAKLLPWRKRWLSLRGLMHVTLHARAQRNPGGQPSAAEARPRAMPRQHYRAMLTELRVWIASLKSRRQTATVWSTYEQSNSYSETTRQIKRKFIADFVERHRVSYAWDIGGNAGDYASAALDAGAELVVVLDADLDALERAYARTTSAHPGLLPIVMDSADPSPDRGWLQGERKGLHARANAQAVFALALVHHLAIGRNIPLRSVIEWLVSLAPRGVIEFVPKSDPMVKQMLAHRADIFDDYSDVSFRDALGAVAEVEATELLAPGGRTLFSYQRRA